VVHVHDHAATRLGLPADGVAVAPRRDAETARRRVRGADQARHVPAPRGWNTAIGSARDSPPKSRDASWTYDGSTLRRPPATSLPSCRSWAGGSTGSPTVEMREETRNGSMNTKHRAISFL
jgi:hypothetical protein